MNKIRQKRKSGHLLLDIIIGLLCVITVGAGAFAIFSFGENYSYSYEADSFYWRLEDEDFARMVEMYYANEAAGVEADEEMQQYYGVAKYFEAASYYKAYQEAQDLKNMELYYDKMESAMLEMNELDFLGETICKKLKISD